MISAPLDTFDWPNWQGTFVGTFLIAAVYLGKASGEGKLCLGIEEWIMARNRLKLRLWFVEVEGEGLAAVIGGLLIALVVIGLHFAM
jgi:hypothetical protein